MKTKLFIGILLLFFFKSNAQRYEPIFYVEYYNSDRNQIKGGLETFFKVHNKGRFFLGLGYGMVNSNKKIKGLLDYHVSYNSNKEGLLFKVSGSDRNIAPIIGLSFLNAVDLGVGYSFSIKKSDLPVIQGFTVGLTVRITRNEDAYERFVWKF